MNNNDKKAREAARFLNNLMSFLADDDLHGEDLVEDLRARGLDPDQIAAEFRDLLKKHAPTWSEKAERERLAALDTLGKVREAVRLTRDETIDQIKQLIAGMRQLGKPVEAGAYHQKFQEATDTDLGSLLQDLRTQYELLKIEKKKHSK
jgi:hypothetical protein